VGLSESETDRPPIPVDRLKPQHFARNTMFDNLTELKSPAVIVGEDGNTEVVAGIAGDYGLKACISMGFMARGR
jgi:hypothetical protein